MRALAQEPGDPQTSLPSTLRLATHYYTKYNRHSARRPARRGVHRPIDHGGSVVDISARASSCYRPGSDSKTERDQTKRGSFYTSTLKHTLRSSV